MAPRTLAGTVLALAVLAAGCSGGGDDEADDGGGGDAATTTAPAEPAALPAGYEGYRSATYADAASWLCRPGAEDVCSRDLDVTSVAADGSTEVVAHEVAEEPAVDCFYASRLPRPTATSSTPSSTTSRTRATATASSSSATRRAPACSTR